MIRKSCARRRQYAKISDWPALNALNVWHASCIIKRVFQGVQGVFNRNNPDQLHPGEVRPEQMKSLGVELGEAILRQARIAAALHIALSARKDREKQA